MRRKRAAVRPREHRFLRLYRGLPGVWLLLGLPLLLALAGCERQPPAPIRLGLSSFPAYELAYLAAEKGFFAQSGLNVEIVEFQSLSDSDRALGLGQIDAAAMPMVNIAVKTARREVRPRPIWILDYSAGADMLVAQPDIPDVAALRGKRVGVEADSLGFHVLHLATELAGLPMSDLEVVTFVDQPAGLAAFERKEIEAMVTYFPMVERLKDDYGARQIFDTSVGPKEILDVIAVSESLMETQPESVAALRQGMIMALRFLAESPEEALNIMAARERVSVADFAEALQRGLHLVSEEEQAAFFSPDGGLLSALRQNAKVLQQLGIIDSTAEVEALAADIAAQSHPGARAQ